MIPHLRHGVAVFWLLLGSGIALAAGPAFPSSDYLMLSGAQEQVLWQMVGSRHAAPARPRSGFSAALDARVPGSMTLHPMSANVIRRLPTLEAYEYVLLDQQLLIVNPIDRRIVDIITPRSTAWHRCTKMMTG